VARDLIGRTIRVANAGEVAAGIIVETEAYGGVDDPASHAAFRPGGRAAAMWREPGTIYVYAAYGMYPCLNVVASDAGQPAAVLVRGLLLDGNDRRVAGPGRVTRALGVTLADHGDSIRGPRFGISTSRAPFRIVQAPRVGIRRGIDVPWRFLALQPMDERT
jgi:DNA-3-methyladenine glycosylase